VSCIEVDAAGLAVCSGLTSLQLEKGVRSRNITTAMAACQQLASLILQPDPASSWTPRTHRKKRRPCWQLRP
jgi:hypothetical protein